MKQNDISRFESKYDKNDSGCWNWKGNIESNGYGRFWFEGRQIGSHRFSYMLYRGPIDFGLTIDHLCKNKICVNPNHLEVVSIVENVRRGSNEIIRNSEKTHCKLGHAYQGENLYIKPNGERDCKTCNIIRNKIWRDKKRG